MDEAIHNRVLYSSPEFELGEFRCTPPDGRWVRKSVARTHLIALPQTATRIAQAGRDVVIATPNVAVLYNAGCEYTSRVLSPEHELTTYVRVGERTLVDAIATVDQAVMDRPGSPLQVPSCATSASTFLAGLTREIRAGGDGIEIQGRLHELLGLVVRDAAGSKTRADVTRQDREYAHWTQGVIAEHFRERMDLRALAARVGLSPFYMCRIFRRVTGVTIHQYRDAMRLRTAAGEFVDTRRTTTQIALGLGYSSQSHLTSAFGRYFGMSPGRFRARHCA